MSTKGKKKGEYNNRERNIRIEEREEDREIKRKSKDKDISNKDWDLTDLIRKMYIEWNNK